jgi:hypothetical protein
MVGGPDGDPGGVVGDGSVSEPEAVPDRVEVSLAARMKRTGDSWALNSTAPVEHKGHLYRFETSFTIGEYLDWAAKHPDLAPQD